MASVEQDMVNELVKQITRLSTNVTDKIAATIMYSGRVKQVLSDNTYLIQYSDEERNFKLKHKTLSIGDEVHVVYPQGSIKDRFLLEDISTGSGTLSANLLSAPSLCIDKNVDTNKYYTKSEVDQMFKELKDSIKEGGNK